MKNFVEFVAKTLVEHPDRVEVREPEPRRFELLVDEADLGRMIGRKGKTAQSLRTLLRAGAGRGEHPDLEIAAHTEPDTE
jgi:predicted RNA-binding protein YlqC (UPF0109 family)